MNPIISELICLSLSIIIILIIFFFIKTIKESKQKKDDFIRYLEGKQDCQNLMKFGFYNANGFKENRRVPFLDKIIFEEYQTNKDETFLEYSVYIKQSSKKLLFLFFSAYVLFCVATTIMILE